MKKIFIFCAVLFLFGNLALQAQTNRLTNGSEGKDFWFSFPMNYGGALSERDTAIRIYVFAETPTLCTLEIPALGINITKNIDKANPVAEFVLKASEGQLYEKIPYVVPGEGRVLTENETFALGKGRGIHITADAPITLYGVSRLTYTSDSFIALPVSSLGTDYIIASYADMTSKGNGEYLPSQTVITAAYDSTVVSFTLGGSPGTQTVGGMQPGETKSFQMDKGDVIAFANKKIPGGDYADLSGSRLHATKPIAVVSGNQCAYVDVKTPACDFLMEMELPTNTWGREYHIPPIANRKKYSFIKVFAKNPNTNLYRDGETTPFATLQTSGGYKGTGYYEGRVLLKDEAPRPVIIRADGPISITQFNAGQTDDGIESDPFQMVLTPVEQFPREIIFNTPGIKGGHGFKNNFVNLVIAADYNGEIPDDMEFGTVLPDTVIWQSLKAAFDATAAPFKQFPGDMVQYLSKIIKLPGDGVYKIRSRQPFAAYANGSSAFDSYGHPTSLIANDLSKKDLLAPEIILNGEPGSSISFSVTDPGSIEHQSGLSRIFLDPLKSSNFSIIHDSFIPGSHTTVEARIEVKNPDAEAKAVIIAVDKAGNHSKQTVYYTGRQFLIYYPTFAPTLPKQTITSWIRFVNTSAELAKTISSYSISHNSAFELVDWPEPPFTIQAGDSLHLKVNFTSQKSGVFKDSINFTAAENLFTVPLDAFVETVAGVENIPQINSLGVSPNPATGFATITLPTFKSQNTLLKVFDALGNEVADFSNNLLQTEFKFDTKTLSNGAYFLRFTDGKITLSRRFVIQN